MPLAWKSNLPGRTPGTGNPGVKTKILEDYPQKRLRQLTSARLEGFQVSNVERSEPHGKPRPSRLDKMRSAQAQSQHPAFRDSITPSLHHPNLHSPLSP